MRARSRKRSALASVSVALLGLSAGAGSARGEVAPPRSAAIDAETELLLVEDHRVPLVYLRLELPLGSWSPWVRRTGAAAAFELQLDDPAGELRREIDRLGAEVTLRVGTRVARVEAACLAADAEQLVALLRHVLGGAELDAREARRRRREARLGHDLAMRRPAFRARRAQAAIWFEADDPRRLAYERPDAPAVSSSRAVELRDALLRASPRRIGFAGDIAWERASSLSRVLLPDLAGDAGGLEVAPNAVLAAPRERAGSGDVTVRLRGLTQVRFAYGRPSLPENDPDYPAFLVADHVLGGHFYSRLHRALRHEGGETYAAYTVDLGDVVPDLYLLETFTRTANAAAAERKLREVLRRFHQGGIDEEEREDALGFLLGRPALRRQSPEQRLDRALRERRLGLPAGSDERAAERAATLSLAEINAFIARFFDPERFAMVRAEPRD